MRIAHYLPNYSSKDRLVAPHLMQNENIIKKKYIITILSGIGLVEIIAVKGQGVIF